MSMNLTRLFLLAAIVLFFPALGWTYEVRDVRDGGSVLGTVRFTGTPPAPRKLLIAKDPEACGTGERVIEDVSISESGGLRNVVVYLEGIVQGKAWDISAEGVTLDQRGCTFRPGILIVPKANELAITNSDPVLHSIHAYEVIGRARRSLFNIAQPLPGTITKLVNPQRSSTVKVECDLHNFMEGWLFVAETPYVTLADDEGRFSLRDIPPGTYTLKAWHPTLGEKEAKVEIQAREESSLSLEFTPP